MNGMKINWMFVMVLGILISIQLIPYGITILFPNLCYGCTSLGKKHQ